MAMTLNRSCRAAVDIEASVESVWELVSDIRRVGEWSVECTACEWIGDSTGPAVGARFRGRNRRNGSRWTRTCEVVAVEAPWRFVWRTLPTRLLPDSTKWTFELADRGGVTRLSQAMHIVHIPALYERMFAVLLPQHRDRTADLQGDLLRIKECIEGPAGLRD